jgi:K+-sensing histidine kinase KdpD
MCKLLLASRLSTGALKLKGAGPASDLARKVVRRISYHSRLHEFKIDFPADFPTVIVEPQMMEQVLTNLVENASNTLRARKGADFWGENNRRDQGNGR